MSDLVEILRSDEVAISVALVEKFKQPRYEPFGEAIGGDYQSIYRALTASVGQGDPTAAKEWAASMRAEATRLGLTVSQVLGGLSGVEKAIRARAVERLSNKAALVAAMKELSDAVDVLRCAFGELSAGGEADLLPARHQLMAVADHCDDFVCLATSHGKPFYLNRAGRRMIGMGESEEITANTLHDYHTDRAWNELVEDAVRVVNRDGRWEGSSQLKHRTTGEAIDVETKMFLVRSPASKKPTCLGVVHQLPRVSAEIEESLQQAEKRKDAILESSLDPIITINYEGKIIEFNKAAEQTFGHAREDVLGTEPSEILFPASKIAGHQHRIDRYLRAKEGSMLGRRSEVTAVRASGETFPAEMAMTMNIEHGEPVMTFFVRDISERKAAEEAKARHAEELERSNQELQQFAYVASHDLQEPLRKIRTFGDRLQSKCGEALDETGREYLQRMQNAAERMQTLIQGLLTLSRVTTQGQNFVPVDLRQVADEVVSDLEIRIQESQARVDVGKMPTIQADPLQIRQLLQNLIGNALKFCRDEVPPLVQVHARYLSDRSSRTSDNRKDEQCRIVVEDNGIGFDEKYADRIFTVFQRLHPRDQYSGTGVGLAICRKIAERHGGTIVANSEPGKGARFTITVPVYHQTMPQEQDQAN